MRIILCALLLELVLLVTLRRIPYSVARAFTDVGFAALSLWLVAGAATGFRGVAGMVLRSGPIVYMGKISYGIYLYHIPVKAFLYIPLGWIGLKREDFGRAQPFVLMAAAIAVAVVSWELFEKPINRLKRHFPYFASAGPRAAGVAGGVRQAGS